MTVTLVVVSAVVALMVLYWIPVRGWYRRSEAQRLASLRTMSGDTGVLSPDYESTLAITIDALATEVWPRLLEMGRGPGSQLRPADAADVSPGDVLRYRLAPAFPVHSVDPGRTLVLGDSPGRLHWRWQFELYPVDPSRTRLLSRTRIRSGPTP
ncbi:MAG TPA: hypothetical protein VD833_12310, partial [Vicinamibacterales bacterium]|nr:hypothetical protein [Vicinamibacterales bacterium]